MIPRRADVEPVTVPLQGGESLVVSDEPLEDRLVEPALALGDVGEDLGLEDCQAPVAVPGADLLPAVDQVEDPALLQGEVRLVLDRDGQHGRRRPGGMVRLDQPLQREVGGDVGVRHQERLGQLAGDGLERPGSPERNLTLVRDADPHLATGRLLGRDAVDGLGAGVGIHPDPVKAGPAKLCQDPGELGCVERGDQRFG